MVNKSENREHRRRMEKKIIEKRVTPLKGCNGPFFVSFASSWSKNTLIQYYVQKQLGFFFFFLQFQHLNNVCTKNRKWKVCTGNTRQRNTHVTTGSNESSFEAFISVLCYFVLIPSRSGFEFFLTVLTVYPRQVLPTAAPAIKQL